jgi:hypothetical protein
MKAVERECQVAQMAIGALEKALAKDPSILTAVGLSAVDLRGCRERLLDTYFIRLFAEFETGIRDYWKYGLNEESTTRIMDVMESISARQRIVDAYRINAHAARRWRNRLVHEEDAEGEPVALTEGRRYLSRFFAWLPDNW